MDETIPSDMCASGRLRSACTSARTSLRCPTKTSLIVGFYRAPGTESNQTVLRRTLIEGSAGCFVERYDSIRCCSYIGLYGCISDTLGHTVRHYENMPIQIYWEVYNRKKENFQIKKSDIFHISAQNIDCGYSLEPPRRGGSNEYPQSMFLSRNKKNNVYPCKPQFYYVKVGFKEVKII